MISELLWKWKRFLLVISIGIMETGTIPQELSP